MPGNGISPYVLIQRNDKSYVGLLCNAVINKGKLPEAFGIDPPLFFRIASPNEEENSNETYLQPD